jgi:glutamyl-tRNA synthetase
MTDVTVVTRFAPSPTGALHVGGARTALYNWAFARGRAGRFVLRSEDTDRRRSSLAAEQTILEALAWLGLDWDEGPDRGGPQGPYRQSERLPHYDEHVTRLLDAGRAYEADGAIRFRMDRDIELEDAVYGRVEVKAADLEDFVIRKADGFPTFHLAVVVDDALMGVTHVIRGQEHLSNTPKHVALFDAFGYDRPVFAHTPSIMNPDGSKMSKRDKAKAARAAAQQWVDQRGPQNIAELAQPAGVELEAFNAFMARQSDDADIAEAIGRRLGLDLPEINVADFRRSGYLPEVLCNYIALLGWNPGEDLERFDLELLRQRFGLERVNKGNARFDRSKLKAFNAEAIRRMPPERWVAALWRHGGYADLFDGPDDPRFGLFAGAYQERSSTLGDPRQLGGFFFVRAEAIEYDGKAVRRVLGKNDGEGWAMLRKLRPALAACDRWTSASVHEAIERVAEAAGAGLGKVAQPLRVAVTGTSVSPPIDQTLVILGQDATLARIDRCLLVTGPTGETGS